MARRLHATLPDHRGRFLVLVEPDPGTGYGLHIEVDGRAGDDGTVPGANVPDPDDRRVLARHLLGQDFITRDELATVMTPHSTVPGETGLLDAVRDYVRRTHDAQHGTARRADAAERDRDANQETAARLTGVVADLSEAAQVLEADVLVRRSDLPPVTDGTDDYAGERVVLCGDSWTGPGEDADDVFDAAPIGPTASSQARRRAGALSALALWLDAQDRADVLAAARRADDDALAELIAGALSAPPEGATAADVVRAMRAHGWQLTAPAAPVEVPF